MFWNPYPKTQTMESMAHRYNRFQGFYFFMIIPKYSCSVWHPHKKSNKDKIEKVQRRAEQLDLFRTVLDVR